MRRYQPLRCVVEMVKVPADVPDMPGQLYDALECGHLLGMVLLPSPSKSPYIRKGAERYRKCPKCSRVEAS